MPVEMRLSRAERIASRKGLTKFGDSKGLAPGIDSTSTTIGDEVFLKLTFNQKELEEEEVVKVEASKIVCRICKGDHWTTKCPFKDTMGMPENNASKPAVESTAQPATTGKYVPPSRRGQGASAGASMDSKKRDDSLTVRFGHLSEDTTDNDLRELISRIGPAQRVFVAKDRDTNLCKGYAFVTFYDRQTGQNCIDKLNGRPYDSLILSVDWAQRD